MFSLKGVHLKHHKDTANCAPVRMTVPKSVSIPMQMHIGAPAKPCVKVGDAVKVGQLVGEPAGGLCSPIYSGVSGTVKKIEEVVTVTGAYMQSVLIETDGLQTLLEDITPPTVTNHDEFIEAVRESGIVGLGGAGFPTSVKLAADVSKIDALVVNGAECEPYITSDTRTMIDQADLVAQGVGMIMKYLEIGRAVIGIENNKPECVAAMKSATQSIGGVEVRSLPALYPQGGEKVLVYHTLGRVIKEGQLPLDCGVIVINCTTAASIAKYINTGIPLVEKCVTVNGSAIAKPQNVIAPIGTSVADLVEFCGGFKCEPGKILLGGPMMGISIPNTSTAITKQTNAVLAFDKKDARASEESACIRCGKCASHCPFSLSPCDIARAYDKGDAQTLEKLKVNICMECGCCSYICPAKRNIVQKNKLAKAMLRNYKMGGAK